MALVSAGIKALQDTRRSSYHDAFEATLQANYRKLRFSYNPAFIVALSILLVACCVYLLRKEQRKPETTLLGGNQEALAITFAVLLVCGALLLAIRRNHTRNKKLLKARIGKTVLSSVRDAEQSAQSELRNPFDEYEESVRGIESSVLQTVSELNSDFRRLTGEEEEEYF